jgi:hypothetical protein
MIKQQQISYFEQLVTQCVTEPVDFRVEEQAWDYVINQMSILVKQQALNQIQYPVQDFSVAHVLDQVQNQLCS